METQHTFWLQSEASIWTPRAFSRKVHFELSGEKRLGKKVRRFTPGTFVLQT